jgi:uncharacterized membrane protein YdjX (TVP38/TMEM64 family)
VGALLLAGHLTGASAWLSRDNVHAAVQRAGMWGVLLYVVLFAAAELLHVPGTLMVAAGILAFGPLWGFPISFGAALVSVTTSFLVVRSVGGAPAARARMRWAWARRVLEHLDERPVRSVALLRLVFWMFPPLNYALALSPVGLRDYVVGSALGLVLPLAVMAALFGSLFGD